MSVITSTAHRFILFVATLLAAPLSSALAEGVDRAAELEGVLSAPIAIGVNGTVWAALGARGVEGRQAQYIFLRGVIDAAHFGACGLRNDIPKTTFNYLMTGLDQFYGDYRNEQVPVVLALVPISMELRGEPSAKVDEKLRGLRAWSSDWAGRSDSDSTAGP